MRVLVICDDYWHPAKVVEKGLSPLSNEGFDFDFIKDARDWSESKMNEYSLVIFCKSNNVSQADKSNWVTDEVENAFKTYVEKGNGLLVIHSGTASYKEKYVIRGLIGGIFTHHPKQCPVTMNPVENHPLTKGCEVFTAEDEHYHMELDDKNVDLFMTTTSEHGTQPGGWTRTQGNGRVCVLTPGHLVEVWLNPSFQTMLKNSMNWCAKNI